MSWRTCWVHDLSLNPIRLRGWELRTIRLPIGSDKRPGASGLHVTSSDDLALDPITAAVESLRDLPSGPLAVRADVDVLDFIEAPLAENTDGRNRGPTLDQVGTALEVAVRDERFRALSIGVLNPTRSAGDPDAIPRFVAVVASTLGSAHS